MTRHLHGFWAEEDGAVTIDWVVLTAALVGLSIAVIAVFSSATGNVGDAISTELLDMGVAGIF